MRRGSGVVVVGMVVTLLATAACTDEGASEQPGAASSTTERSSPGASSPGAGEPSGSDAAVDWPTAETGLLLPDGTAVHARIVEIDLAIPAVEGVDYAVEFVTPEAVVGQDSVSMVSLEPEGTAVVSLIPAEISTEWDGGPVLPAAIELGRFDGEDIASFGSTAHLAAQDNPRQTIAGDSDGRWVAWAETDSTDVAVTRWRVFAQDTASEASGARLIARSEDVVDGELPPSWNDAGPVIGGGRAYWHLAVPAEGTADGYSVRVVSTALDGSEALRVEAEAAVHPASTARGLTVLTDRDTAAGRAMGLALVPEPGRVEPLLALPADSTEGLSGLVGDGHRVAFTGWRTVYAVDLDTREVWAVPLPDDAPRYVHLSLCGDLLHWSVGQSSARGPSNYVLDLASGSLHSIDVPGNYGDAWCAGEYLAWSSLTDEPGARARTTVARWAATG